MPINCLFLLYRLRERGKEVCDLVLRGGGYVYICGDGCSMAKDVTRVLVELLSEHGDLSQPEAEAVLNEMRARRRFVLDIWS